MRLRTGTVIIVIPLLVAASTWAASAGAAQRPHVVTAGYRLVVPPSSAANENASANAVACSTAGYCLAVGFFARSSVQPSLALTWVRDAAGWHRGTTVALPPGSTATATSSLGSVSCAAPGRCLAVGTVKASSGASSKILVERVLGGVAQRGVAIAAPNGFKSPTPFAWCSTTGACEVVGTATGPGGATRLFTFTASLSASTTWHTTPVVEAYSPPAGLPSPNDGGRITATDLTCVSSGNCIVVGSLTWRTTSTATLPFTVLQVAGAWQHVRLAPVPSDVATSSAEYGAALNAVSCAGAATTLAASHCIAVGSYQSTAGPRQLEEKEHAGAVTHGPAIALPTEGVFLGVGCRSANQTCLATGYSEFEGEAGAASAYSVGSSSGFTTLSSPPLVVGGGDPFDWLTGDACLVGRRICVATGQGTDDAANDPIVVTFSNMP